MQPGLEARQCDQCRAELRAPAVREDGNSAAVRVLEQRLEEVEAAAAQREAEELLGAAWVTWIEIGYPWISSEVAGGHNLLWSWRNVFFFQRNNLATLKVFLCLSAAAVALVLVACGWQQSLLALAALAVFMRRGGVVCSTLCWKKVFA